jgi:acetoin:2,6-dichlorophenolindophenol oxidoreductase subunit alpha
LTFRMRGHGERDHQLYVDREELARWGELCPVRCYGEKLLAEGFLTAGERQAIQDEMEGRVKGAEAFADMSPFPAPEEALDDLWVVEPRQYRSRNRR